MYFLTTKLHETTFNPENFYTMILTLLIGADLIILVMSEVILGERRGEERRERRGVSGAGGKPFSVIKPSVWPCPAGEQLKS